MNDSAPEFKMDHVWLDEPATPEQITQITAAAARMGISVDVVKIDTTLEVTQSEKMERLARESMDW